MLLLFENLRFFTLLCYTHIGLKWFRCSLISDVKFARTLTTTEKILSISLSESGKPCLWKKKHKTATFPSYIQKGSLCSHNLCIYIPHIVLGGQSESKAAPLYELNLHEKSDFIHVKFVITV